MPVKCFHFNQYRPENTLCARNKYRRIDAVTTTRDSLRFDRGAACLQKTKHLFLQALFAPTGRFSRRRYRQSRGLLPGRYRVTGRRVALQDFDEQRQVQPDAGLVLRAGNRPYVTGEPAKDRKISVRILGQDDQRHFPAESDSRLQKDRGWRRRRRPVRSGGGQHGHREAELIQRHRSELRSYQQLRGSRGGDVQLGEHRPQRRQVSVARRNYKALRHEAIVLRYTGPLHRGLRRPRRDPRLVTGSRSLLGGGGSPA